MAPLLVTVFELPPLMPVRPEPADTVLLLAMTLVSLTLIAAVPLSLTLAPVSTFTVRLVTPPPAAKPSASVPLQVTVCPLAAGSGAQSACAGIADRPRPRTTTTTDEATVARRSPIRPAVCGPNSTLMPPSPALPSGAAGKLGRRAPPWNYGIDGIAGGQQNRTD